MNEGIDKELGHTDDEPGMLANDLGIIERYARELKEMVEAEGAKGETDFPHWWQSKVTIAKENMVKAKHYLRAELEKAQGQMESNQTASGSLKKFSDFVDESVVNEAKNAAKDARKAANYANGFKNDEFGPFKTYRMMGDASGMSGGKILIYLKKDLLDKADMKGLPIRFDIYMDDMDLVRGDKTIGKMTNKTLGQAVQLYTKAVKQSIKMAQKEA